MSNSANNRFVILHHQVPAKPKHPASEHWDLMLEDKNELLTWAIQSQPHVGKLIEAKQLANHRLKYLDYEGPISDQRGSVSRFLAGRFAWIQRDEARIKIELHDLEAIEAAKAIASFVSIEILSTNGQLVCNFS